MCVGGGTASEGAADGFPTVPLSKVGRYVWKWARSHWGGVAESWRVHCLASRGAKGLDEVEGVEEFNCSTGPRGWDGSGELTTCPLGAEAWVETPRAREVTMAAPILCQQSLGLGVLAEGLRPSIAVVPLVLRRHLLPVQCCCRDEAVACAR
jgi:hypothetical protein